MLNSVFRATAWTAVPGTKVGLHSADPGALGTTSELTTAGERIAATWGAPAGTPRAVALSAAIDITVAAGGSVTHFSVWTTDGTPVFIGSGTTTNRTLAASDIYRMGTGTTWSLE